MSGFNYSSDLSKLFNIGIPVKYESVEVSMRCIDEVDGYIVLKTYYVGDKEVIQKDLEYSVEDWGNETEEMITLGFGMRKDLYPRRVTRDMLMRIWRGELAVNRKVGPYHYLLDEYCVMNEQAELAAFINDGSATTKKGARL